MSAHIDIVKHKPYPYPGITTTYRQLVLLQLDLVADLYRVYVRVQVSCAHAHGALMSMLKKAAMHTSAVVAFVRTGYIIVSLGALVCSLQTIVNLIPDVC